MAHSMSVDGTDLATYSLYVTRGSLPGMPGGTESMREVAQSDGAISSPRLFSAIEISTDVVIAGTSYANLLSNLDSIKGVLGTREDVEVAWDRWADRYWLGRCQLSDVRLDGPTFATATIVTLCADPFGYASTESTKTETSLDIGVGGQSFTVTSTGTAISYPEIVFTAGGTSTALVIEHDALDTRLVYDGTFVSGDKLRIKCDPANWTVDRMPSGDDTYSTVMSDIEGQWPHLEVGDNVFTIYDFEGSITWTWRNRYL